MVIRTRHDFNEFIKFNISYWFNRTVKGIQKPKRCKPIILSFYDKDNYLHLYNGQVLKQSLKPIKHKLPCLYDYFDIYDDNSVEKYRELVFEILVEYGCFANCKYDKTTINYYDIKNDI